MCARTLTLALASFALGRTPVLGGELLPWNPIEDLDPADGVHPRPTSGRGA